MNKCNICEHSKLIKIDYNNLILRTDSKNKHIHNYESFVCENCGVLNQHPQMDQNQLSEYYNSDYRNTGYQLNIDDRTIDFPLKFDQTGISFQRFYHFHSLVF